MTVTNLYVHIGYVCGCHVTFSVTQFAFGIAVLYGDGPGEFVIIAGPFVISRKEVTHD